MIPSDWWTAIQHRRYEDIRGALKDGDLLLCSGNYAFSHLIRTVTGSDWSHVAIILKLDMIDRVMVMESVESAGVRTVPLRSYVGDYQASGNPYDGRMLIARHTRFDTVAKPRLATQLTQRAVDLFVALFGRKLGDDVIGMATGETVAHLNCLINRGRARRTLRDGVLYYEPA